MINFDKLEYIGCGSTANVYKINDKAIKLFIPEYISILSEDMFDFLKSINDPNFMKLEKYKMRETFDYKYHIYVKSLKYYTYLYIKETNSRKKLDYFLDNFDRLEKFAEIFNKNGVKLGDLNFDNTVLQDDNIVLIDPDNYIYSSDLEAVKENNRHELTFLFIDIISHSFDLPPYKMLNEYHNIYSSSSLTCGIKKVLKK